MSYLIFEFEKILLKVEINLKLDILLPNLQ